MESLQKQCGTTSASHHMLPRPLLVLGEDRPADVVRIPDTAAGDRPDRPRRRQTRVNAARETTEELDSFQRARRATPEHEIGGRLPTDRLPPAYYPVRGLEIGCLRDPGHETHPLV